MRKILVVLLMALASQGAMAQHYGHGGHRGGNGWGWVAPAIIGGALVYGATRQYEQPPTVIYTQPAPIVNQQAPIIVPKYQYAMPDTPGTAWRQDWRYDQFCNCYRQYLIQIQ